MEDDTRYSGASWAVLSARKSRITSLIEGSIEQHVAKRRGCGRDGGGGKESVSSLIHSDCDLPNLLEFECFGTADPQQVGPSRMSSVRGLGLLAAENVDADDGGHGLKERLRRALDVAADSAHSVHSVHS